MAVDWSLGQTDPIGEFNRGYTYADQIRQAGARVRAGRTYAAGDVKGAAGTLAASGNIKEAEALTDSTERRQNTAVGDQVKRFEAQHGFMQKIAPFLKAAFDQGGPAAAVQAYTQYAAPQLKGLGVPDEQIAANADQLQKNPQGAISALSMFAEAKTQSDGNGGVIGFNPQTGEKLFEIKGTPSAPSQSDLSRDANNPFKASGEANEPFQTYERGKADRASAAIAARQSGGGGGGGGGGSFAGKTANERMMNILLDGEPNSPQYDAAYAYLAKPKVSFDPNTGEAIMQPPDMSWARPPARQRSEGAPPPGQPKLTTAPGRSASPARATFEANVKQAERDVGVVEQMFFPGEKFNRELAVTGALGVPLSKGREARQAVRRAVEIILRLRTGAAAPVSEVNNYTDLFSPSALDNDSGAKRKMLRLKEFFEDERKAAASKIGGVGDGSPKIIDFNDLPE